MTSLRGDRRTCIVFRRSLEGVWGMGFRKVEGIYPQGAPREPQGTTRGAQGDHKEAKMLKRIARGMVYGA